MAWTKIFLRSKYATPISWDNMVTIACAFAISKAMENSVSLLLLIARPYYRYVQQYGPYAPLAIVFIITNIFTELIPNKCSCGAGFDRLVGRYAARRPNAGSSW